MKTNAMKQALARGETQVGIWINMVRNPAILRLMKSAGLDFARFDMEHASPSIETLSNMALLARALDFTLTVRPPEGNREWITRLLDAGVWSLHVPPRRCRRAGLRLRPPESPRRDPPRRRRTGHRSGRGSAIRHSLGLSRHGGQRRGRPISEVCSGPPRVRALTEEEPKGMIRPIR
jgi:hypothetical protein